MAVDIGQEFKIGGDQGIASAIPQTIGGFISAVLPNVFIIAGVILLLLLLFGGFMTIMNSDNPEAQDKGKQAITSALIGFVIIFASYWIIQIIQVLTGVNILKSTL
jgi:heme/copper-type cytochrome/quinol oxidase subunit 4